MIDTQEFKTAVGKYPTGIVVISTHYNGIDYGFTANTFVSVSLDPPLVLFCLNKNALSFNAFCNSQYFVINILASDQQNISTHFASKIQNKFSEIDYQLSHISKSPIIAGAISHIECKLYNNFNAGDHNIFLGQVISTKINPDKRPLLHFERQYLPINFDDNQ